MHNPCPCSNYIYIKKRNLVSLECRSRPLFHLGPLHDATPSTTCSSSPSSIRTIPSRNRRRGRGRRSKSTGFSRPNGRSSHHRSRYGFWARAGLNDSFPSIRVVEFLCSLFLCGSSFSVSCHLGFDFHATVEFLFCYAAFALRVAFFLY